MGARDAYFSNEPFPALHGILVAFSLFLFFRWVGELESARRRLRSETLHNEERVRRVLAPLARFDTYFDFCSSGFIFIGLLGTVFGFIRAIPLLNSKDYRFHDLSGALATSGAGIILALSFNFLTTIVHAFRLGPTLRSVLAQDSASWLESTLSDHLQRLSKLLEQNLGGLTGALTELDKSVVEVTGALRESMTQQTELASATAKNTTEIAEIHARLKQIPKAVLKGLEQVFEGAAASLAGTIGPLKKAAASLEAVPVEIQTGLQKAFKTQLSELEQAFRGENAERQRTFETHTAGLRSSLEVYETTARALRDETIQVLRNIAAKVEEVFARTKTAPQEFGQEVRKFSDAYVGALREQHGHLIEELRRVGAATIHDQVQLLNEACNALARHAAVVRNAYETSFQEERAAIREAVIESLREMAKIIDAHRQSLHEVQSTLPAEVREAQQEVLEKTARLAEEVAAAAGMFRKEMRIFADALASAPGPVRAFAAAAGATGQPVVPGSPPPSDPLLRTPVRTTAPPPPPAPSQQQPPVTVLLPPPPAPPTWQPALPVSSLGSSAPPAPLPPPGPSGRLAKPVDEVRVSLPAPLRLPPKGFVASVGRWFWRRP